MSQADHDGRTTAPYHLAVMAAEVVELFRPLGAGMIVDATFGGGGHTRALLEGLPGVEIVAIDRDPDARAQLPSDPRVHFVSGRFSELITRIGGEGEDSPISGADGEPVSGVLFDLGVSSHQLDTASRGFSFRSRGPLDMRMGPDTKVSAREVVNEWPEVRLAETISRWGDEPNARRIARAVVAARPIADTAELAEVVAGAMPAAVRRRRHPARRTFQAIRMAVNEEEAELRAGLDQAIELLSPGGRIAVITYHSIEDRIVKRRFAQGARGCECPPDLPVCVCGKTAELRIITRRGITPTDAEIEENPRARSARLRGAEKVAA